MQPRYPIYIISKGRWKNPLTAKAFNRMNVKYRIVIEPQELKEYSNTIDIDNILVLPFSNLGEGSIPARNWVWEHSIKEGHKRHWILDDNIGGFCRYNNNTKIQVNSGATFAASEDFTERYTNVVMSGMNYFSMVPRKSNYFKPFIPNTRIYSIILLDNSIPYKWRGRYNEDTDLSLRILKDGYCTILFNAFLATKRATMSMAGGNTEDLYKQNEKFDGRLAMAQSLQKQHPDVVRVSKKWGRWQHHVDYRPFKKNILRKKDNLVIKEKVNNYGMELKYITDSIKVQ